MFRVYQGSVRGIGDQEKFSYVQVGFDFRDYIHQFKGPQLAVFMAIVLHSDENGWSFPSVETLSKETGYLPKTVSAALTALCEMTIEGSRILFATQEKAEGGKFKSNHYLVFPSPEEIAENANIERKPREKSPYTVKRYTVARSTAKVGTKKNQSSKNNHLKEEIKSTEEELKAPDAIASPPPQSPSPHDLMFKAIEDATKLDSKLKRNAGRIARASKELREGGYVAADVTRIYGPEGRWWDSDWRGQKNENPTPDTIIETIGKLKSLNGTPPPRQNGKETPNEREKRIFDNAMKDLGIEESYGQADSQPDNGRVIEGISWAAAGSPGYPS